MKLLVCGGREFNDLTFVEKVLDAFHEENKVEILIEGGSNGADMQARTWAVHKGIHVATVPALWHMYPKGKGNPAGPKRNAAMLLLKPDYVIAFPGNYGTQDMVYKTIAAGITGRRYALEKNGYRPVYF